MIRRLLTLVFCFALACNAGQISFSDPVIDTQVLPNASTTVLMHFDGDFTDISGNIWTNGAWNGFSTNFYKFGNAAGADGKAKSAAQKVSYVTSTTATSSFKFGTGDYTIEFWVALEVIDFSGPHSIEFQALLLRINGSPTQTQFEFRPRVHADKSYEVRARRQIYGNYADTTFSAAKTSAEWIHLAFERVSGVSTIYINGSIEQTSPDIFDINYAGITDIHLQAFTPPNIGMNVYIDELRVTTGGYVYGGAFTPPTRAIGFEKPMQIKLSDGEIKF